MELVQNKIMRFGFLYRILLLVQNKIMRFGALSMRFWWVIFKSTTIVKEVMMRLYICYAATLFCLVLSIGELQAKSSTPPIKEDERGCKFNRIGRHIMTALDSIFAALFTMNSSHVQEAYTAARTNIKDMDTD